MMPFWKDLHSKGFPIRDPLISFLKDNTLTTSLQPSYIYYNALGAPYGNSFLDMLAAAYPRAGAADGNDPQPTYAAHLQLGSSSYIGLIIH